MSRYWLLLLRLAALLAVAVSCALMLHYLAPVGSGFCGPESACETVRKSAVALGTPALLPGLGVAGYVAIFWITFTPALRRWLMPLGLVGAGIGLALLLYQALALHAFCWMCVTVDGLALLVGITALLLHRTADPTWGQQWDQLTGWGWFVLLAVCVNAPSVWPKLRASEPLPKAIQELQTPGVLTVVEFVDFECPHCRRQHPIVSAELAGFKGASRVIRYHVPLAFHVLSNAAARAALCAEQFERGEAMANRLFAGELEPEALFTAAADLGIPAAAFRDCLDAMATWETLAEHRKLFNSLKKPILPLTYVGRELLEGYTEPAAVAEALRRASRPAFASLTPYTFGAVLLLIGGSIFAFGRRQSPV